MTVVRWTWNVWASESIVSPLRRPFDQADDRVAVKAMLTLSCGRRQARRRSPREHRWEQTDCCCELAAGVRKPSR